MEELHFTAEYQAAWSAQLDGRVEEADQRFEVAKLVATTIHVDRLPALILRCRSRFEEIAGVTLPGSFR